MKAESTKRFPCFVADTSFLAAYLLNGICSDEFSDCVNDVDYVLQNNGQIYVPQLFWYEMGNVLLSKTRRKQKGEPVLSRSDAMDIMYDLQFLPIYTESQNDLQIRQRIFDLATDNNLSYYDASYLELSRRTGLPLKTYDADLKKLCE
ncbi:MAG: type II toxin-antitoxin system VapC family toxin [Treponema sp.]|nr:type II toxin-antitoxin system VapC family toxin [Treponema sp.]